MNRVFRIIGFISTFLSLLLLIVMAVGIYGSKLSAEESLAATGTMTDSPFTTAYLVTLSIFFLLVVGVFVLSAMGAQNRLTGAFVWFYRVVSILFIAAVVAGGIYVSLQ